MSQLSGGYGNIGMGYGGGSTRPQYLGGGGFQDPRMAAVGASVTNNTQSNLVQMLSEYIRQQTQMREQNLGARGQNAQYQIAEGIDAGQTTRAGMENQNRMDLAGIQSGDTRYVSDANNATNRLGIESQERSSLNTALQQMLGQLGVADRGLEGSKYGADQGLAGQQLASDTSRYNTDVGARSELGRQATDRFGFKTQEDIARLNQQGESSRLSESIASQFGLKGIDSRDTRYVADSQSNTALQQAMAQLFGTRYTADANLKGALGVADRSLSASNYGADQGLAGALGVADRSMAASNYSADRGAETAKDVARVNAQANTFGDVTKMDRFNRLLSPIAQVAKGLARRPSFRRTA